MNKEAMEHDAAMEKKHTGNEPVDNCRSIAAKFFGVSFESTYCVMFAFVLGGYKAWCSSSEVHGDRGQYIEVVYDQNKEQFYVIHYTEKTRFTVLET